MFGIPVLTFKLLIVSIITAKRQLIHNRTAQRNTWNQNYDFIIVGAGGSGCVVANRLSEDPNVSVLLLEAGGPQDAIYTDIPEMWSYLLIPPGRPQIQFTYYNEPQDNLRLIYPDGRIMVTAGRLIGGSTSHNELSFFRAQRKDLDNWVNTYGAKGWSYEEALPFYIRFENNTDMNIVRNSPGYHGVNGPVQISSPRDVDKILLLIKTELNNLGYMDTDISGVNQTGTTIGQVFVDQNGFRSESGNAYVDHNPHPNNLHIVTRAMVIKILFNGLSAVGVEFDRNDTSYRVYARKEVILSAGPFQTPQLLMLSGIGIRNHLQSFGIPVLLDLPVGNNYQYIIDTILSSNNIINEYLLNRAPDLTINNLIELYFNKSGALSQISRTVVYFSTISNSDKEWPNIAIGFSIQNRRLSINPLIGRLRSRGTVRLQSSNPYVPPKLNANIYSDASDLGNAIEALKFPLFLIERTSLAQYIKLNIFESAGCPTCPGMYMYECTESIRCYLLALTAIFHPAGTCRMEDVERNDVVVDPTLRVKNAKKLRICDTSIIPELPNSGIASEALMIGEKCSQIIKDTHFK